MKENNKHTSDKTQTAGFGSSIRNRLVIGFSVIVFIFIASVFINLIQHNKTNYFAEQLIRQDIPSIELVNGIANHVRSSSLSVRNYILTGDKETIENRKNSWVQIRQLSEKLNILSNQWENENDINTLKEIDTLLSKLQLIQNQAEAAAST